MERIALASARLDTQGPAIDPLAELQADLDRLATLDLAGLRSAWRQRLRKAPPPALPRPLLLRLLCYRLQARRFGDLSPETARLLDRLARDHARRRDGQQTKPKAVPVVPPVPREPGPNAGAFMVREYAGVMHRVAVLDQGYAWNGTTYASLSEIARAITGTRWSGPRFFGLKLKSRAEEPA